MKKILIIMYILFTGNINLYGLDILAGLNIRTISIEISEEEEQIASIKEKGKPSPVIGLRTSLNYFKKNKSNWGYFYQLDASLLKISKQEIDGADDYEDLDTSLKGFSISATPTAFYHFNKKSKWSQKAGLGFGVGYLSLKGDFMITTKSHKNYKEIIKVDKSGLGTSYGAFFEYSNDKHSFVIQNFGPVVKGSKYKYQQHGVDVMYRYKFNFDIDFL